MKFTHLFTITLFLLSVSAQAVPITRIPIVITKPGKYTLTKNLTAPLPAAPENSAAITIRANNVELDLGGFAILVNPTPTNKVNTGIIVDADVKEVKIHNGRISGFRYGLYADLGTEDIILRSLEIKAFESCANIFTKRITIADCGFIFDTDTGSAMQLSAAVEGQHTHFIDRCRFTTIVGGQVGLQRAIRVVGIFDGSTTVRDCSFVGFGRGIEGNIRTTIANNIFQSCLSAHIECVAIGYNQ